MITANSRPGKGKKTYVQDKIEEHAHEINVLLLEGATFYVCGAAAMAKDVNILLEKLIAKERKMSAQESFAVVKEMRASGQYQEDAWS